MIFCPYARYNLSRYLPYWKESQEPIPTNRGTAVHKPERLGMNLGETAVIAVA